MNFFFFIYGVGFEGCELFSSILMRLGGTDDVLGLLILFGCFNLEHFVTKTSLEGDEIKQSLISMTFLYCFF